LTIRIIAKTASQKTPAIVRGGRLTVLGSGGFTETPINAGGLASYNVPIGKKTSVKGTLVVTNFGNNNLINVNVFDSASGRTIPIGTARTVPTNFVIQFECELTRNATTQQTLIPDGDNSMNNGIAEWYATLIELPG